MMAMDDFCECEVRDDFNVQKPYIGCGCAVSMSSSIENKIYFILAMSFVAWSSLLTLTTVEH